MAFKRSFPPLETRLLKGRMGTDKEEREVQTIFLLFEVFKIISLVHEFGMNYYY